MRPVETEAAAEAGEWPAGEKPVRRLVLPRVLRRPARILSRVEWRLPRLAGVKGLVLLFAATGIAGVVTGGHMTAVASAVTAWAGLAIDEVEISGQSETSEVDVLDRLAIGPWPSIVTFDPIAARERVEALPWVKRVTILKLFPDTLQVKIEERAPYAIWQREGSVALIDRSGKIITDRVDPRYAGLPMVVGEGAAEKADVFLSSSRTSPRLPPA